MSKEIKADYLRALNTYKAAEARIQVYLQNNKEYQKVIANSRRVNCNSPEAFHALSVVCFIEGAINEQYKMQTIRAHLTQCEDKLLDAARRHTLNLTISPNGDLFLRFQNDDLYQKSIGLIRYRTPMLALAVEMNW